MNLGAWGDPRARHDLSVYEALVPKDLNGESMVDVRLVIKHPTGARIRVNTSNRWVSRGVFSCGRRMSRSTSKTWKGDEMWGQCFIGCAACISRFVDFALELCRGRQSSRIECCMRSRPSRVSNDFVYVTSHPPLPPRTIIPVHPPPRTQPTNHTHPFRHRPERLAPKLLKSAATRHCSFLLGHGGPPARISKLSKPVPLKGPGVQDISPNINWWGEVVAPVIPLAERTTPLLTLRFPLGTSAPTTYYPRHLSLFLFLIPFTHFRLLCPTARLQTRGL